MAKLIILSIILFVVVAAATIPNEDGPTELVENNNNWNMPDNIKIVTTPPFDSYFVQTHKLPPQGLQWTLKGKTSELHLIGDRETLLMIQPKPTATYGFNSPPTVQITCTIDNKEYSVVLTTNPPDQLPPTEAKQPPIATNAYSVRITREFVRPGMKVVVNDDVTQVIMPKVGMDGTLRQFNVPFYLFGATDATIPIGNTKADPARKAAIFQTWPVANLEVIDHPMERLSWDSIVMLPANNNPAYKIFGASSMKDGYDLMNTVLPFLKALQTTSGEVNTNQLYYSPLIALNIPNGNFSGTGGGLGGGTVGAGDHVYSGIFIHEMGHAMGLPHAGEAYNDGQYPYVNGSLKGSVVGFDMDHNEFLDIYISPNATDFFNCQKRSVMFNGKCVRQDPMQSGSGAQSKGYPFSLFSDFNMAGFQLYLEGNTTINSKGEHVPNGKIVYRPNRNIYEQWDTISLAYVQVKVATASKGLYGQLNLGLPTKRDVDIYTIFMQHNSAPTSTCVNCSIIYPLSKKYKGNLVDYIDPTNATQLATITPNTGDIPWYCHSYGCDYTMRVTYDDGSLYIKVLAKGVRGWFKPTDVPHPNYSNPLSSDILNEIV
ncbi:hypothetical protein SAMD00019534_047210 [Acytostelium subglobosum LB1]|uniref:hypothetical protein n=1 Tax=Acytostelium subglobosum LB1 TaxID=1410327 RepID=UPI0006449817|nr:hypothetical protein SAMD00019534_047210 [Acytostelium subglobosum LB1]GAM21546.1 hypothetical protein SAMD00019534_047210 [Acytostelium subglobosum LB1]|eukprot:XP_012755665.1 hypothetical protein SAMD00019534_047210 [Acytostelium subglobosum LB1]